MTVAISAAPREKVAGFSLLYVGMFVISAGNLAMMSIFPAIARSSGIPDALMVGVQSLSAGLAIVATPFWASRSDRVGRKRVILLGITGFTIASLLTAGAIFIATHRLVPLAVAVATLAASRLVFGGLGMATVPATQAHVADETSAVSRTRTLASLYSANGLGSVVGPGLAPFLILPIVGLAGPQIVFAVIGTAIFFAVARRLPNKAPIPRTPEYTPDSIVAILRKPSVWPFVIFAAVLSGCQAANLQMLGFVIIDTTGLPPVKAQPLSGMALMAGAIAAVTIQIGLLRRLRLSPTLLMASGAIVALTGNLLMVFSSGYNFVALSFLVTSIGYAIGAPGAAAGASLANSADHQGGVAGMISGAAGSGLAIAPVIAMLLYHHNRAAPFVAIAAALVLIAVALVPRCARSFPAHR